MINDIHAIDASFKSGLTHPEKPAEHYFPWSGGTAPQWDSPRFRCGAAHVEGNRRGGVMTEPEHIEFDLPRMDCRDDPRGGAVAWALFAVGVALIAGTVLAVIWAVSV
jgi:hypothetical protein